MDNQATKIKSKRNPITLIAGGFLVILYFALCSIATPLGREQFTKSPAPTLTPALTITPHILVTVTSNGSKSTIHEGFSSNPRDWGLYYPQGKLQVINGKLILQSDMSRQFAVGINKHLAPSSEKYYVQADFSTDSDTKFPYGLVFGLSKSLGSYYMFEIMPGNSGFRLSKYNAGKWVELIPSSPANLNPYPQANTLSIYFDHGNMDLYVNGELESNYADKDFFQSRDIGVFVSNIGYQLFVDDFFVLDVK